jgi:hypothetical protein
MIEIAQANINSFAPGTKTVDSSTNLSDHQLIALTYGQLEELTLRAVEKATEPLKTEIKSLKNQADHLEKENLIFKSRLQGFSEIQDLQGEKVSEHASVINTLCQTVRKTSVTRGGKTTARIEEIKEILKDHGGSLTFITLQDALGLTPSQFSKLVNQLDKRSFEVSRRPGSKKGEKVLRLKVRITDGL